MEGENRSNYWPQILLIAAAAANLFRFAPPLKSSRPAEPPPQERRTISDPNIEARLWQDPFEAVALREARFPASRPAETNGATPPARYSLANLVAQMQWFARNNDYENQVTVLAVMLPGNVYSEGVEQRLRARYAVLAGLIECGIRPEQSEFIGQMHVPWFRSGALRPEFTGIHVPLMTNTLDERTEWLGIPYEWLAGRVPSERAGKQLSLQAVLVLWLREEAFADYPRLRLAQLLGRLREDFHRPGYRYPLAPKDHALRLRVIGPAQSSTLIRMLEPPVDRAERRFSGSATNEGALAVAVQTVAEVLRHQDEGKDTQFLCATATAADEVLMIPPNWTNSLRPREYVRDSFAKDHLFFASTCATDRQLLDEILDELGRRGIKAGRRDSPVAVLTEYDTFYGRVMAETFTNLLANRQAGLETRDKAEPMVLHYLRGVDGRVAGEGERKADKPEKKEPADGERAHMEVPEGRSQLDYVPRLVRRLRTMENGNKIKAIGILGSDVYDKLLLLQSLRQEFPDVIFFTTELDARLFHPRELAWSRNLLVASSYGLQLRNELQGKIPPFRDAAQTALFVACLRAMKYRSVPHYVPEPRLFEIGRLGPVDLSISPSPFHPSRPGLEGKPDPQAWRNVVWAVLLLPLLVTALAPLSPRLRSGLAVLGALLSAVFFECAKKMTKRYLGDKGGVRRWLQVFFERVTKWAGEHAGDKNAVRYSLWTWILLLLFVDLLAIIFINHFSPEGEVFSVWDGVSIWPSEILRLLGFYLSLGGLIYSWRTLAASTAELSRKFQLLPKAVHRQFSWRHLFCAFLPTSDARQQASISQWKSPSGEMVSASEVWSQYLHLGSLQNRLNRFVPPSVLYFVFGLGLVLALGAPMVPYRGGPLVVWTDRSCLFLLIPVFILLMFAVLDDTRLCTRMIQLLAEKPTDWGPTLQKRTATERSMSVHHVDDYLDMRLIAERTAAVSSLIYLPFGLLALMVVSRNDVFDRWGWPPSMLALFGLNSLFTLYSAISLKRAAGRARGAALSNLQGHLLRVMGSDASNKKDQADQIRATMEEIRSLRQGAFAPLSVHPALGAALLPFGGAGVVALLNHLAGS